jgi:anti-sigma factor RsiW
VLTCFRTRRRIGAYLDGALEGRVAETTAMHLKGCATCQREADTLRRLQAMLRRTLNPAARGSEPDWTGFWPGIVRGIEDARGKKTPPLATTARKGWWSPRWALGGAALAVGILSFSLFWQVMPDFLASDPPVIVSSAHTDDPNGTVMVYSGHGKDVTVVWVLGLEESSD